MNIEEYRNYCISKKGVTESFPFDETTLVFKVMDKMFALAGITDFAYINLKCDPERAIELREKYEEITPGFHMNKQHWNSVSTLGDISDKFIFTLIDDSYKLIVSSLTKNLRQELETL